MLGRERRSVDRTKKFPWNVWRLIPGEGEEEEGGGGRRRRGEEGEEKGEGRGGANIKKSKRNGGEGGEM